MRLFGINQKDAPENALAFLTELGNPYDAIGADANGRTSIDWGVYGVPETFVVNAEGVIPFKHIGPLSPESLDGRGAAGDREGEDRRLDPVGNAKPLTPFFARTRRTAARNSRRTPCRTCSNPSAKA